MIFIVDNNFTALPTLICSPLVLSLSKRISLGGVLRHPAGEFFFGQALTNGGMRCPVGVPFQ